MSEINVTPLVDVVLVLLIIFMVTAPFLQGGLEVDLPKVATSGLDVHEGLIVSVRRGGTIAVGAFDRAVPDRTAVAASPVHPMPVTRCPQLSSPPSRIAIMPMWTSSVASSPMQWTPSSFWSARANNSFSSPCVSPMICPRAVSA